MKYSLEKLFNLSMDLICIASTDGMFLKVNPSFSKILGYDKAYLLKTPFLELVHPSDREATLEEMGKLADGNPTVSFENRYLTRDGKYIWLQWTAYPETDEGLIYAVAREYTSQVQSREQLKLALNSSPSAMITVNRSEEILYANDEALRLFGYGPDELTGKNFHILVPTEQRKNHSKLHHDFLENARKRPMGIDKRLLGLKKDCSTFPIELGLNPVEGPDGFIVICGINDLSEIERREKIILSQQDELELKNRELEKLASFDPLTGLTNRRILFERIEVVIEISKRQPAPFSLVMVDVDRFKSFNDDFGHQAGDYVLKTMGKIFSDYSRSSDTAARYGGEEFCIFLPGTDSEGAMKFAEGLRKQIENFNWKERQVTASFGIFSPGTEMLKSITKPEDLIEKADQALYMSKKNGRNRVTAYDE